MPAPGPCHFFIIPAEVHVRIYELVLVSSRRIKIHTYKSQPAILCACRQTRQEAISIYYARNTFAYQVRGFKGAAVLPFSRLIIKYSGKLKAHQLIAPLCYLGEEIHFANLGAWLRGYYRNPRMCIGPVQSALRGQDARSNVLACWMFGVVKAMRKIPWKHVKRVLDVFYDAICALDDIDNEVDGEDVDDLYDAYTAVDGEDIDDDLHDALNDCDGDDGLD
ncbi:hypothetical protein LTR53_014752 [Teratosphaeriaceae sp. CCFEE 6253]|nr:hypothetical protein LTR53_014752 [Teratosphaeriaceae sp. CCFEE 6253]